MLAVKRSLGIKQATQVTLVSLIIAAIFTIILLSLFIEERRENSLQQLERLSQSIMQPLSEDVWNMDYTGVQNILDALNALDAIVEADVIVPSEYQTFHGEWEHRPEAPQWFMTIFRLPLTSTQPIYAPEHSNRKPMPIGYLILKADSYLIYKFISKAAITMMATFLCLILLLATSISSVTNRLLVYPLKLLALKLMSIPKGTTNQLPPPRGHDDDELGLLVRVYNENQSTLEKAYQDLRRLSTRDSLTDLPNRVLFEELLSQYISNSYEEQQQFNLLYISINSIKETSRILGLPVSDQLLLIVINRLKKIIGNKNVLARLGGEEFIVLVSGHDKSLQAMVLAQDIIKQVTLPIDQGTMTHILSANIGIATYPNDGQSANLLLINAHSALTSAERQGKNTILFFEPYLTESIQKRLLLENDITRGIHNDEFKIYLQPQIDMRNNALVGVEALVRWHDPLNGIRPPSDFIPLAEETGLIIPLGEEILEQACQYLADWQKRGIKIPISVNLAAAQLYNPDFPAMLERIVSQYCIEPQLLKLEMTETGSIERMDNAITLLKQLHSNGFAIVLDDFGIGYSNLNYLRLLNIDTIKIDKSFVQDALPHDNALIQIVATIAEVFDVNLIAEGVETVGQREWLLSHNIFYGQGYLFDPALPKDILEQRYLADYLD